MLKSKSWHWENIDDKSYWLNPNPESYYLLARWQNKNFKNFLDFGSGLGRNAIFFAKNNFITSAFDLSQSGIDYLEKWSKKENLKITAKKADMLNVPYKDQSFDCMLSMNVISHTDTKGITKTIGEAYRLLKPGGEFFTTICSKSAKKFQNKKYPKLDENTVVFTDEGPDKDMPHFHADYDDLWQLFKDFKIKKVSLITNLYDNEPQEGNTHYNILVQKPQ